MKIDIKRVESDLFQLSKFGFNEADKGVYRQGLTDVDMEARRWLLEKFNQVGMESHIDGVGNVCGRFGNSSKPAVIIGSHIDSVPAGGIFDGTLGVIAGLEIVRVLKENNIELEHPIEVIGTSEEEGRFGGMLGAQALTGQLTIEWLESAKDPNGERLVDALKKAGLEPYEAMHARRDPKSIKAFLELHIEQGPVLEAENKQIGIVTGISGVYKWLVKLIGKADHAGTAPMNMRSDAFMGVADFAHEISRIIDEEGSELSRLTIGSVELKPGYAHTIPGEADFTLVGRDLDPGTMENLANACRKVLSAIARKHHLMFEYEQMSWLEPRHFSSEVYTEIESIAKNKNLDYMLMPSGAGHDCQFFADIAPTGLIFIPSVGGISHAPDEWSHWDDVECGCNLLLDTVLELARS
ncbi:Zn-dependent hydrolase [Aliikangiella sp. G2MR2-5]|uniref:Zn-dependent hydrolase n=1 Tax=Aliikangiella sp. G2MR2-5 TaxID=2788943 RepID=UPI0018A98AFC|nr:Zn-dependent hydrolase [Aliikangiella sp. G2MR2-5]